jgi:hypothetical protein
MILNNRKSPFERDFIAAKECFPKLDYSYNTKIKMWVITGELDICDVEGMYWNTFHITMLVPRGYPYCVPIVAEKSTIIPRDIDWHISPEGICCLDISHNLKVMSKLGINLTSFIREKVYTYFANQLYKLEQNKYAGEEYAHHLDGIIQYYIETHQLQDKQTIVAMLQQIISKANVGRNDPCPCGNGKKTKHCHQSSIDTLKTLGNEKLLQDFKSISETMTIHNT